MKRLLFVIPIIILTMMMAGSSDVFGQSRHPSKMVHKEQPEKKPKSTPPAAAPSKPKARPKPATPAAPVGGGVDGDHGADHRAREAAEREYAQRENELNEQAIAQLLRDMVYVEGSSFRMGSTDPEASSDEKPRMVEIRDFHIGKYEVTQRQWIAIMGSNPSAKRGDRRPVENVSWYDCQQFIRKLNEKTGKNFRLPTEEEWEYASRGGKQSHGYKYSGSNDLGEVGWYEENSGGKTQNVGQKEPNELGLYDMSGNVAEWCDNRMSEYRADYSESSAPDIRDGSVCITRGGSWYLYPEYCRNSARDCAGPSEPGIDLGFRLAY
ncbi:MAG: SUMF1/EgtB/PvdO family nonheme iron enzyme [Prevotella sp.]|nr:SUMF1/EgtB/PvdO family nonheme iron enzyme [Prevotella sp.]